MITELQLLHLQNQIEAGKEDIFYSCMPWMMKRAEVLRLDHFECQLCKEKGRYRKAKIVHHVKHLRERPDLALSIYDGEERQLVSLCKQCHEKMHPEHMRQYSYGKKKEPVTVERWD